MRTTRSTLGALAVAAAVALAACGDSDDATNDAALDTAPSTSDDDQATNDTQHDEATASTDADPDPSDVVESLPLSYAIPVAAPGMNGTVAVFAVGEKYGFFEDEGVDVDLQFIADGTALQVVASGNIDATAAGATNSHVANQSGAELRVISGYVINSTWTFVVEPESEIESIADLDGTTLAVSSLASSANPTAKAMLSLSDVDPNAVEFVATGGGVSMVEALESGAVDVMVNYVNPLKEYEAAGYELRELPSPELSRESQAGTAITTSAGVLADPDKAEALTRFLRAAYRGLVFSHLNPEAAVIAGWEVFPTLFTDGADPDEELATDVENLELWLATIRPQETQQYTDAASLGDWGHIPDSSWEVTNELGLLGGSIDTPVDPSSLYDASLLAAANDFDRAELDELAASASRTP